MNNCSWLLAFPLFASLILLGCGGYDSDPGCVTKAPIEPIAAYVGSYTATFTPKSAKGSSLVFSFTIDADGSVKGTAHDPSIFPKLDYPVTGTSAAISGCGYASELLLDYSPASGDIEEIGEAQKSADTLVGAHAATWRIGAVKIEAGTLTISKVSP